MKQKLFTLGNCFGAGALYASMVDKVIPLSIGRVSDPNQSQLSQIEKGDIVLFGGGEDISPSIYNEPESHLTHATAVLSTRDSIEVQAFEKAQKVGAFSFGICRGAQLLCALAGGKLIQHVNNHAGRSHWIVTKDKRTYLTSSAHHQMMWPYRLPKTHFEVLATSKPNLSNVYAFNVKNIQTSIEEAEPEVVLFPKINALGIQGHPEFMSADSPLVQYSRELLETYFIRRETSQEKGI